MKLEGEFMPADPVVDGITEGEVRFDHAVCVHSAVAMSGTSLGGSAITVTPDMTSKDGTKVIVRGFGPQVMWQELKDHFKPCGTVAHADVKGQSKGKGRGSSFPSVGEVRMSSAEEASLAVQTLNGSQMSGSTLSVQLHGGSKDGTKLQVSGIPPGAAWQELKDLFGSCGTVMHADTAPIVPGQTFTGEVRYDDPQQAMLALKTLNGTQLGASQIFIALDPASSDSSKLTITGISPGTGWQELKDHFATMGTVAFADVHKGKGGGKGGLNPWGGTKGACKGAVFGNAGGVFGGQMAMMQGACGKGAFGKGGSPSTSIGEVRMSNAQEAFMSVQMLNGSQIWGSTLQVNLHPGSQDSTKLQVSGIPPGAAWQELKDLFASCGTVMHADVAPAGNVGAAFGGFSKGACCKGACGKGACGKGGASGGGKGFPRVPGAMTGTVRYETPIAAQMAMAQLNGAHLCGAQITVDSDWNSQDGTKLWVAGIAPGTGWQELKDLFAQCGPVAFCNVGKGSGKGKF
jgi:RNA recognition motif-containing protein